MEEKRLDEKDRLGDKLRDRERGEEERYFAERERKLIAKLKQSQQGAGEHWRMRCPKCGERLASAEFRGVKVEECPGCKGMWLDRGEVETVARSERGSWLDRFLGRSRR